MYSHKSRSINVTNYDCGRNSIRQFVNIWPQMGIYWISPICGGERSQVEAPFFVSCTITCFIFQYLFGMIYSEQSQHQTKLWIFTTRPSYNAISANLKKSEFSLDQQFWWYRGGRPIISNFWILYSEQSQIQTKFCILTMRPYNALPTSLKDQSLVEDQHFSWSKGRWTALGNSDGWHWRPIVGKAFDH